MGDMLSQAEIDALLGGTDIDEDNGFDNLDNEAIINDPYGEEKRIR